jgi:hypothetical protein
MVCGQEEATMSSTLRKTMGFALAGLLCIAPLGMTAGTATEKSPGAATEKSPATPGTPVQQPRTTLPNEPTGDRMVLTVEGIDQSKGMLKLRGANGDRMEFTVPKGLLASLHEGDRVHVAIQKAPGTPARAPSSGTERQRPEQAR